MDNLHHQTETLCRAYLESKDLEAFMSTVHGLVWAFERIKDSVQVCSTQDSVKDRMHAASQRVKRKREESKETLPQSSNSSVQILLSNSQVDSKIAAYIVAKKEAVNASNQSEFVSAKSSETTCARTDAKEINRNTQMKLDLAVNEEGPLDKSTHLGTARDDGMKTQYSTKGNTLVHLQSRLATIEQHLRIKIDPNSSLGMHQRLKVLEDAIIQLEEKYPCWSAVHFDHTTVDSPMDPFGQSVWTNVVQDSGNTDGVSLARFMHSGQTIQPPEPTLGSRYDKAYSDIDSESINKRIEELKKKLLGKK